MSITRANVAAYLNSQFGNLAAAVGQNTDPLVGFAPDVDSALRRLGTAESDLADAMVADSSRDVYFALSEYYACLRFWRQLSDRANVNLGVGTFGFDFKKLLDNAKVLTDAAAARCAALGVVVDGSKAKTLIFQVS